MKSELMNYCGEINYKNEILEYKVIPKSNKVIVYSKIPRKYDEIKLINELIEEKLGEIFIVANRMVFDFRSEDKNIRKKDYDKTFNS
ncbi:MAG: hypothetical protein H6586_04115 [Flavobacteriales bacterium]|nr:hypothetical protein [Flavobacteriales bacterium]